MSLRTEHVAERAVADAATAAARAGIEVKEIHDLEGEKQVSALFDRVWGKQDQPVLPSNLLHALTHAGNYLVGAWKADYLLGAAFGFFGSRGGETYLHSHMTGVDPDLQARGIGLALKLHQRAWALSRGLSRVEWTFDPLVRHNAFFNIMKLGATVIDYHDEFYGDMADSINAGDESDRVLVSWDLASERVDAALRGAVPDPEIDRLRSEGAVTVLDVEGDRPVIDEATAPTLLCHIPADIVALRKTDPVGALAWRRALRQTFGEAMRNGYRATSMTRDGWYVLEREIRG